MDNIKPNLQLLIDMGYENMTYFTNPDFDDAIIGISHDGCVIYDYDKMIESLMKEQNWTYEESVEWIDYNTIRTIPYMSPNPPIVLMSFDYMK